MTRDEALKLLRGGKEGVAEWNRRRSTEEEIPSLDAADLSGARLEGTNLISANLMSANFHEADLSGAILCLTNLDDARLEGANLFGANLIGAKLNRCYLTATELANTRWGWTSLAGVDLRDAHGLDSAVFEGPCSIGVDTLVRSKGQVPESFLRGCGFQPWQIIQARTYDPDLTAEEFTELQYEVIIARNQGPLFIGSVFISYSSDNAKFADKIRDRLAEEGAPVYLDRHNMVAGDVKKQIKRAIRVHDVVLLVLSEASVNSDWVEYELEVARKKEKDEDRNVLCPVALDDAWKAKMDDPLWRQAFKKHVLDFSKWETKAFEPVYQKLTAGLKVNYGSKSGGLSNGDT